ncbi:hypothetical protein GCM10018793_40390 [Streptomyces sulfonofaciens]|uniref:SH3 domain-containing protein n=1 Tax=Streptomyces sulfonofaciens TaxID=68272 RepID=A0A919GDB2_9ACTN|nr:SH3 domain-containing protein [Streptomyces sulfonofaciens]GHH81899.1 hypothetical protein GCM10018793_40390 [Streptomyces sulfonofaciens]
MFLRSPATRFATAAATGAVVALAAAGPAAATAGAPESGAERTYQGRVTARTGLLLRDAPNRGGTVVGSEPYNAIVTIYCRTRGENVDGNDRWYLLADGTWAWGAARYIANIGDPPPWC